MKYLLDALVDYTAVALLQFILTSPFASGLYLASVVLLVVASIVTILSSCFPLVTQLPPSPFFGFVGNDAKFALVTCVRKAHELQSG